MSNKKVPRGFIAGDRQPPRDHELILDGIRFMEEELGLVSAELPATYTDARYRYEELRGKLRPPTPSQVALVNRLVGEVGGTASGKLHSRRHTELLIKQLKKLRSKMRADAGPSEPRLRPAVLAVVAGIAACLFLWSGVAVPLLILTGTLVFVVAGAFHVLGRWAETLSILFRSGPPGE